MVLGRLATQVATILRGKHKPIFAPHVDTGDHVIVVNAAKVVLTAGKADQKFAYRHSGYPGGLKTASYADMMVGPARRGRAPGRARHAAPHPPRPPAADQAQGLRRPRASPRGPASPPLDIPGARARI